MSYLDDDCWEWPGRKSGGGYGIMKRKGITYQAHRFLYEMWSGLPIPDGMCVCHRCDNPPCVNPSHLFLGTKADNNLDRDAKGRTFRGPNRKNAKLTDDQVRDVRRRYTRTSYHNSNAPELAEEYGVSRSLINQVASGRARNHV